jgi:hypothetical protein
MAMQYPVRGLGVRASSEPPVAERNSRRGYKNSERCLLCLKCQKILSEIQCQKVILANELFVLPDVPGDFWKLSRDLC